MKSIQFIELEDTILGNLLKRKKLSTSNVEISSDGKIKKGGKIYLLNDEEYKSYLLPFFVTTCCFNGEEIKKGCKYRGLMIEEINQIYINRWKEIKSQLEKCFSVKKDEIFAIIGNCADVLSEERKEEIKYVLEGKKIMDSFKIYEFFSSEKNGYTAWKRYTYTKNDDFIVEYFADSVHADRCSICGRYNNNCNHDEPIKITSTKALQIFISEVLIRPRYVS